MWFAMGAAVQKLELQSRRAHSSACRLSNRLRVTFTFSDNSTTLYVDIVSHGTTTVSCGTPWDAGSYLAGYYAKPHPQNTVACCGFPWNAEAPREFPWDAHNDACYDREAMPRTSWWRIISRAFPTMNSIFQPET